MQALAACGAHCRDRQHPMPAGVLDLMQYLTTGTASARISAVTDDPRDCTRRPTVPLPSQTELRMYSR
jgi:hypothetical protein